MAASTRKPPPWLLLSLCVLFLSSWVLLRHHPGLLGRRAAWDQRDYTTFSLPSSCQAQFFCSRPAPLRDQGAHHTYTRRALDLTQGHRSQSRTQTWTSILATKLWGLLSVKKRYSNFCSARKMESDTQEAFSSSSRSCLLFRHWIYSGFNVQDRALYGIAFITSKPWLEN